MFLRTPILKELPLFPISILKLMPMGRRFALPGAKMFKPVGLKTQERNTANNPIYFSMH